MSSAFILTKMAAGVFASLGVSKIVSDIVINNTNVVTIPQAILVRSGSLVIGSMVVEQSLKHVDERFDAMRAWYLIRKEKAKNDVSEEVTQ